MAKIQRRFGFLFPINTMSNRKPLFIGNLNVSYIGYEYPSTDPDERYEVDVDSVKWNGMEIIDLLSSEQFEETMAKILDAADNDVVNKFDDYRQGKVQEEAEMILEMRRIS